jgi:hypothetical protein
MTAPVVYVSTYRIKEGKFETYRRFHAELLRVVEENEPRVIAFYLFANEAGTEVTHVHVYPDTIAMDHHMQVLADKMGAVPGDLGAAFRLLEPVRIEVFGNPGDRATAMDKLLIEAGAPYILKPRYVDGFARAPASVRPR